MRREHTAAAVPVLGARGLVAHGAGRAAVADGVRVLPRAAPALGRAHRAAAHGGQLAAAPHTQRHQGKVNSATLIGTSHSQIDRN